MHRTAGYSLVELLVALALTGVVSALVASGFTFQSNTYISDIGTIRIHQNVRSAMDILSMNVRQAGEGFDGFFPAVLLSQSGDPMTSVLTVRRKLVHEVLPLCADMVSGATHAYVSDPATLSTECLPANVADSLAVWVSQRVDSGGTLKIFIFDRVAKVGEFLEYQADNVDGSGDYLLVSSTTNNYPASSTRLYVIEEYRFSLDPTDRTLQLAIDGDTDTLLDVAYEITEFNVGIRLQDGTTITALDADDETTWKDIRAVTVSLTGQESWRSTVTSRTVSAEYFPRNVLSN